MKLRSFRSAAAFSLIEMMVVISIIAVIAAYAVPAVSNMVKGSAMTQASQEVSNQLSVARQYAITKNRSVEVRFLKCNDPELPGVGTTDPTKGQFRGIQLMEVLESGGVVQLDKPRMLPQSVLINPKDLSSILDGEANTSQVEKEPKDGYDPELPRGIKYNYRYVAFRFLPNGGTNLKPTGNWYFTVHPAKEKATATAPPPNFFTLQIDPVSGSTRVFRPNLG